jgi:hypothetical protein
MRTELHSVRFEEMLLITWCISASDNDQILLLKKTVEALSEIA